MRPLPTLLMLLLGAATPAGAAEDFLPGLFGVTGVATGDVLNVRAAPDGAAAIVGSFAPDRQGIEVIARDPSGHWGEVGLPEGAGWVAMRYLAPEPWPAGAPPDGMACVGTEPFWRIAFADGTARYSAPGVDWPAVPVAAAASPVPPGRQAYGFAFDHDGNRFSGTIEAAACSDGMSDRPFGWKVTVLHQGGDGSSLAHGCCSLARP